MLHIHRADAPTAWSRRCARCWPSRCPIRSRPRSSPCPRAAWSAGSRSGCRIGSGRRPGARRGLRERRVPVAAPARRRRGRGGVRDRPRRGSVAAGAGRLAAARGRRRVPRRAVAAQPRRAPRRRRRRADPARRARRFSTVRHLAELFDRYALHRPRCCVPGRVGGRRWDGRRCPRWRLAGGALAAAARADRRARIRPSGSRRACARLREEPGLVDLPARLSLFGLTRLPAGHLNVLRALAVRRDVHLFLLHPSPALWERVAEQRRRAVVRRARRSDRARCRATGCSPRGGRTRASCSSCSGLATSIDHHHPVEHARPARCSRACRPTCAPTVAGRRAASRRGRRPALDTSDRSVQVHACHGRARQVEVLRDAILHLLEDDPTLEPRDVIVMCPDIETFAPLIQATFGAGEVARRGRRARRAAAGRAPARPARAARRPLAAPDQPGARRRRAAARARRRAADRLAGARPRRPRAGAAALPARRRRPRAHRGLGRARAASAGASTPRTARRSSSTRSPRARGAPGSTGCWSA